MLLLTSRRADHEGPCEAAPQEHLAYLGLTKRFPHCDQWVLHNPKLCEHCAMREFSPLHAYRLKNGINYTGEYAEYLSPCPSLRFRSEATINQWARNRPSKRT